MKQNYFLAIRSDTVAQLPQNIARQESVADHICAHDAKTAIRRWNIQSWTQIMRLLLQTSRGPSQVHHDIG